MCGDLDWCSLTYFACAHVSSPRSLPVPLLAFACVFGGRMACLSTCLSCKQSDLAREKLRESLDLFFVVAQKKGQALSQGEGKRWAQTRQSQTQTYRQASKQPEKVVSDRLPAGHEVWRKCLCLISDVVDDLASFERQHGGAWG